MSMAVVNEQVLEAKLSSIESARAWSPRTTAKLEALIRSSDDLGLFRVSPIKFAAEKAVPESEAIDLFLHAARAGLFEMDWMLLCPGCGDVVESFGALKTLGSSFHCDICHKAFETVLDDRIEVSFTVSPQVRDLVFHHPETLSAEDYYFKYQFRSGARLPDGTLFTDLYRTFMRGLELLPPGGKVTFECDIVPGVVAASDRYQHAEMVLATSTVPAEGLQTLSVRLKDGRFLPEGSLAPGKARIEFINESGKPATVFLVNIPQAVLVMPGYTLQYEPFLSGTRLFSNQTFRNLFRSEVIQGAEGLRVNDLTVLFSDLKGSTGLYDRIGDLKAFSLVHRHFEDIGRAIAANNGAIVKTIGDAVMASFTRPEDAVKAAVDMLAEIGKVNEERGAKDLALKIGIHKGPSIAVTLNDRLDYFGQNINIASRVQALAGAEEIFLTQDVHDSPGVAGVLAGCVVEPCVSACLKGIKKEIQVYKVRASRTVTEVAA